MDLEEVKQVELFKANLQQEIEVFKAGLQKDVESFKADRLQDNWRQQSKIAFDLEHRKFQFDSQLSLSKAQIDFALASIRGCLIVNGGAVVALLALAGQVWKSTPAQVVVDAATQPIFGDRNFVAAIGSALDYYAIGLLVAVLCAAVAYSTQSLIVEFPKWERTIIVTRILAIALILASLALFALGCWTARTAFTM